MSRRRKDDGNGCLIFVIVCNIGSEEAKLLLYDDFSCYDHGVFVGQVSSDVIKQLRKAN